MASRTVLHDVQAAAGAKLIDFHGWDMPVQFAGIVAEHQAVRTAAGVFDLGHMGRLRVVGNAAAPFLMRQVCRPLAGMDPGQVRYGMVLAEDGTVEDDVLVSKEGEQAFHVVVNSSNKDKVLSLFAAQKVHGVGIEDLSAEQAMLAVQGPKALERLAALGLDGRQLRYYAFADLAWRGTTVRLSRTGYTGEDGAECFLPAKRAVELWQAIVDGGTVPCGLGARDTLRLEAGMPLYGQELDRTTTPVEAGLAFAVGKQGGYTGDRVVLDQLAKGTAKKLVGLRMLDKRVPRTGYPVMLGAAAVGRVTSGTLSPTVGAAIGMAYVATEHAEPGTKLEVDIRGTRVAAEVVKLPFYSRPKG